MATTTATPTAAKDFECPNCGGVDFRADYYQAVHQGCTLVVEADGSIHADDFSGDEETYDDGCTQDESYRCEDCGWTLTVGDMTFTEIKATAVDAHCRECSGSRTKIAGCRSCCRDCGFPCASKKDDEGFHFFQED